MLLEQPRTCGGRVSLQSAPYHNTAPHQNQNSTTLSITVRLELSPRSKADFFHVESQVCLPSMLLAFHGLRLLVPVLLLQQLCLGVLESGGLAQPGRHLVPCAIRSDRLSRCRYVMLPSDTTHHAIFIKDLGNLRSSLTLIFLWQAFTATILGLTGVAVCKGLAANGYMGNTGAWGIWDLLQPTIVSLGVVAISLALRTLLAWADADDYVSARSHRNLDRVAASCCCRGDCIPSLLLSCCA